MSAIQTVSDLFGKQEDLLPELEAYLDDECSIGTCLRHPLVYQVPYHPATNAFSNAQYRHKIEYANEAKRNKNWVRFIFIHERAWRIEAFRTIQRQLTDAEYWQLLGEIWVDSENIFDNLALWKKLWRSQRQSSLLVMDKDDDEEYQALPDEMIVFRGCKPHNVKSLSWTLSAAVATKFAKRFVTTGDQSVLVSGTCLKRDVLAYFGCRQEQEIVILPKKIKNIKQEIIT